MRIGYFPGCSLHGTAIEYAESLKAVSDAFQIELVEIEDWNCCGATAAHALNHTLSVALPARTLALAEKQGFDEILVPCAACYSRLVSARHDIQIDEHLKVKIPELIEMPYTGKAKPINVLEFVEKYIQNNLKDKIIKPFDFQVACYYGCLLERPPKVVNAQRYEDPLEMDNIIKKIGGKPIDWAFKTECCGAGLSVSKTEVVAKLSGKILDDAMYRKAEVVVVACPMCQSNLDMRRDSIDHYLKKKTDIPVLFITQAIGLALGIEPKKLGLHRHIISTEPILKPKPASVEAAPKPQKELKEVS